MIELSGLEADDGRIRLGFAGDTCNTAIYLARLLGPTARASLRHGGRAGQPLRRVMIAALRTEGIDTDLIARLPDRLPGIYAIEIDAQGERSFPLLAGGLRGARDVRGRAGWTLRSRRTAGFSTCRASRLRSCPRRTASGLVAQMKRHKAAGRDVAFDGNYRPKLWAGRRRRDIGSVRRLRPRPSPSPLSTTRWRCSAIRTKPR
jgi:2-dehydro-3-deoxygluconokinase